MITSSDTGNAIFRDVQAFGIDTYQEFNVQKGEVTKERIVILPKRQQSETICDRSFVEVNFVVPDINGEADRIRLAELERKAKAFFNYASEYDGTTYDVEFYSSEILNEEDLNCHYVNVRILFNVLNVK